MYGTWYSIVSIGWLLAMLHANGHDFTVKAGRRQIWRYSDDMLKKARTSRSFVTSPHSPSSRARNSLDIANTRMRPVIACRAPHALCIAGRRIRCDKYSMYGTAMLKCLKHRTVNGFVSCPFSNPGFNYERVVMLFERKVKPSCPIFPRRVVNINIRIDFMDWLAHFCPSFANWPAQARHQNMRQNGSHLPTSLQHL